MIVVSDTTAITTLLKVGDDLKARAVATGLRIKCAGLLGVLVRAKLAGEAE